MGGSLLASWERRCQSASSILSNPACSFTMEIAGSVSQLKSASTGPEWACQDPAFG